MLAVDAKRICDLLTPSLLREALREAFRCSVESPMRHHHLISRESGEFATLLLMPAWDRAYIGIKIATVFPDNAIRNTPTLEATYLLMAGDTGTPLAVLDGRMLTLWRTAAASALAADYLALPTAHRLLFIGAGALAPYLIRAHAAVRPITDVMVWSRDASKADRLAAELDGRGLSVRPVSDLAAAASAADIVSAATMSVEPLIEGQWLKPGAHVDLVGGYTPAMREADDATMRRASVFVDTRAGAMREAGDIVQPLRDGVIDDEDIVADLFDLCRGRHGGRMRADEITCFKSVGTAIEDLAAAVLVYKHVTSS